MSVLRFTFFVALWTISTFVCSNNVVNPIDYGVNTAVNGVERYNALYKAHCAALKKGATVSYKGIDSLEIEIPADAKPIPLGEKTDFGGMVLTVVDNTKDAFVYEMIQKTDSVRIENTQVDDGDFSKTDKLRQGLFLLVVSDKNPWVENRKGYNYGHIRRDMLVIKDGKAQNHPISSYDNDASSASGAYCRVTPSKKFIKNLKMQRAKGNQKEAFLFDIKHQYNVEIRNIAIHTPKRTQLVNDRIIRIVNSASISLRDVTIDGTYSQKKHSGYGLSMNNVYDSYFCRLNAHGNWGVFGTNNMHKTTLKDCDINRFDIHCYGGDVTFESCTFRNLYNQFASIYGKVHFYHCKFVDFIPIAIGKSYNAYTKFDVIIHNCLFLTPNRNLYYLIKATGISDDELNKRSELSTKEFPNVFINGLKIKSSGDIWGNFYIFNFGMHIANDSVPSIINLKNIEFLPGNKKVSLVLSSPLAHLSIPRCELLVWGVVFALITLLRCKK